MTVPTLYYIPFYILGILLACLDHTCAIVIAFAWGLTTIILNHVINNIDSPMTSKEKNK